ncbi:MAG: acetate kinase [Sulfurimonas sp.]|jgi:acetate kinase
MKIAVINSGSSSIKFQLLDMKANATLAHASIEKIGEAHSIMTIEFSLKKEKKIIPIKNHQEGLEKIISFLSKNNILKDFSSLNAIGHRIVHGGDEFKKATIIDDEVIRKIEDLKPLAPLHNPAHLEGIAVTKKLAPNVMQVAVFDTSFHLSMPQEAYLYALNQDMYKKHKIRKYGFHGTSYSYVVKQTSKVLKMNPEDLNIVALHLGNGSSTCAIKNGKSIDTSMGFTPLEGLIMGTRCGDIDPAVVVYMQRELGLSVDEVDNILNKKSGLLGICGENDVRSIVEQDTDDTRLALDMMARRIRKYIGAYLALLGRIDAIVFSGGIGENSAYIRSKILKDMPFGIELDDELNEEGHIFISKEDSPVKVIIVRANEELEIANECLNILNTMK